MNICFPSNHNQYNEHENRNQTDSSSTSCFKGKLGPEGNANDTLEYTHDDVYDQNFNQIYSDQLTTIQEDNRTQLYDDSINLDNSAVREKDQNSINNNIKLNNCNVNNNQNNGCKIGMIMKQQQQQEFWGE